MLSSVKIVFRILLLYMFFSFSTFDITVRAAINDDGEGNFTVTAVQNSNEGRIDAEGGSFVTIDEGACLSATGDSAGDAITITGGGYTVTVESEGSVISEQPTGFDNTGNGMVLHGDENSVQNYGEIIAGLNGIVLTGDNNSITNNGTINAEENGITVFYDNDSVTSQSQVLTNYGTITGNKGISFSTGFLLYPNEESHKNTDILNNYATITGTGGLDGEDRTAIDMGEGDNHVNLFADSVVNGGIQMGSGADTMINSGLIQIESGRGGIYFSGGDDYFDNSGTIMVGTLTWDVIAMCSGNDTFKNSGNIDVTDTRRPAVSLGDGNDSLVNEGNITIGISRGDGIITSDGHDRIENFGHIHIGKAENSAIMMSGGDDSILNGRYGVISIGETGFNGIMMAGGDDIFTNHGVISFDNIKGSAIALDCGDNNDMDLLENSGEITIEKASEYGILFSEGSDSLINSGVINIKAAEKGGIEMGQGDDILTNSGTIKGTVSMGAGNDTVTLFEGAVFAGSIDGGGDNDTFNLEGSGSFSNDLLNFEILNKTGDGIWDLKGNIQVENSVDVHEGTLGVQGKLGHGTAGPASITVFHEGVLRGDILSINGDVTNLGILDLVKDTRNTVNIAGDYVHGSGNPGDPSAMLNIGLDANQSDILGVSGKATLNGGVINVMPDGVIQDGSSYTVLTAGTLAGNGFDEAKADSITLSFTVDHEMAANRVILNAHRRTFQDAIGWTEATRGALTAAKAFQQTVKNPSPDGARVLQVLDNINNPADLKSAFNMMSPEPFTQGFNLSSSTSSMFNSSVMNRLNHVIFSISPEFLLEPSGSFVMNERSSEWVFWEKGFGIYGEQDADSSYTRNKYHIHGFNFGADKKVGDNYVIGATLGVARASGEYDGNGAETRSYSYQAGLYGSYYAEDFYLDATFFYAMDSYDTIRYINFSGLNRVAQSEHDGSDFALSIGGGYNGCLSSFNVIPTFSLQYVHHDEDAFTEMGAGALNLSIDGLSTRSFMSIVGIRINRDFMVDSIRIIPEITAQWGHEFGDTEQNVTARFVGATAGAPMAGKNRGRNNSLLGLSVAADLINDLSLFASYDLSWQNDHTAQNFQVGIRFTF